MAISTTSWISCPVPFKKTDVVHQIASVPGAAPGGYIVANNHETSGACLQWLRDKIVAPDDRVKRESVLSSKRSSTSPRPRRRARAA